MASQAGLFSLLTLGSQAGRIQRRTQSSQKTPGNPDYDCNADGVNECRSWNYGSAKCNNGNVCEYRYRFGDTLLQHSCRCRQLDDMPTEYDCDGDGAQDCRTWDYGRAQCGNGHKCEYRYRFGDTLFDQSCRCQAKCLGPNMASECPPVMTDYDCNGDGTNDCGEWKYGSATCGNLALCERKYKFGDITLDQSCRCRACARTNSPTDADADRNLVPNPNPSVVGNSGYWARWINWADHVDTCAPWMMPSNDADLRKLLDYAKSRNYIVRPSGAGHSAGGLVNDGENKRVMVVSLGAYTATGEWEFSLNEGAKLMKVNAGWSQLDVYERIRPKNLFFPTQTAGYFFQVAGVVANSVHGAGYSKSFVHAYVTQMRVMLHDGSIKIISDEDELKYWRNSYGLLGLILGVEMKLEERVKHQMYTKSATMAWNEENYWKFIFDNAEADLPVSITGGKRSVGGSQKSIAGEFFINLLPDKPGFIVYANKENTNCTEADIATGVPRNLAANYQQLREEKVSRFQHNGKVSYGESVRKEGCPALYLDPFQIVNVNKLVGSKLVPTLARVIEPLAFASQTLQKLPNLVKEQRDRANDGFFAVKAPNTLIAAYFIKPELSFKAFNFMREAVKRRNGQATWFNASGFSWNQPAEFRFMKVTDDAVLQPVPPGIWFVSEILSFPDSAATDQEWKKAFKEVEDYWVNELGAIPHLGKLFGFEEVDGKLELFNQKKVCKVYSSAKKNAFKTYQSRIDPAGRFNYGLGEKLLRSCAGHGNRRRRRR